MITFQNLFGLINNELPGVRKQMLKIDDPKNAAKIFNCLLNYIAMIEQEGKVNEQKKVMKLLNRLHLESCGDVRDLLELLVLSQIKMKDRKKKITREYPYLLY
jgi:hypothetical protein